MRILMSGTGGMIGSVVAPYLESRGHEVVPLVRRKARSGEVGWDPDAGTIDAAACEGFDGVVHLATMPWPLRWTPKAKAAIRENRLRCNGLLADTISSRASKPAVFVFASGMGIYPSSGEEVLTEESRLGTDFIASLQREGEAAAGPASAAGVRVVPLRIPMVLAADGVRRSASRIGDGRQWMSWVSRDELAAIVEHVLVTPDVAGAVNACSPEPARNADLAATACGVLGRKPGPAIPTFLLRLLLGEMGEAFALSSRRMVPKKLLDTGYEFRHPMLADAMSHELGRPGR